MTKAAPAACVAGILSNGAVQMKVRLQPFEPRVVLLATNQRLTPRSKRSRSRSMGRSWKPASVVHAERVQVDDPSSVLLDPPIARLAACQAVHARQSEARAA